MRSWCVRISVLFAIALSGADAPAADPYVNFVPWKVLQPGDEPLRAPLVLYWVPSSREELRRSDLLTSRTLLNASTQCVAMQVIRPDDDAMIEHLGAGTLPVAILTTDDEKELARVTRDDGDLRVSSVEQMVRDALDAREGTAETLLDEAQHKLDEGDADGALVLYEKVWEMRCSCPRQANEAKRAMKKLKK